MSRLTRSRLAGSNLARAAIILAAIAALGACAAKDYTREGTTQDQFDRDLEQCRRAIDAQTARDRAITTDRQSTVGATDQRLGNTQLRDQMDYRSETRRREVLTQECLTAKGYQPKR